MADIPCKYPVEKCPQRTYTYSLKGTYRTVVGGIGFFLLFALLMAAFLFILGIKMAVLLPLSFLPLPIFLLVTLKPRKKCFISFGPDGMTFCGALNLKDGFRRNYTSGDFSQTVHFEWAQIQLVGFISELMNPSCLILKLSDGEIFYFPLTFFRNAVIMIDNLRRFTGYFGCKDYKKLDDFLNR